MRKLRNGEVDAFVYLDNSKAKFYGKDGDRDRPYYSAVAELVSEVSSKRKPLFTLKSVEHGLGGQEATPLDYTVTGVIAISLLTTGMFSAISTFSARGREGTLRRIRATPVPGHTFVLSMASTRLVVGLLSTFTVLGLSKLVFHTVYRIRWIPLTITTISGMVSMLGLGVLLAFVFRRPEAAQTAGSLLMTVTMFFSGVYFPPELLPKVLREIGEALPAYYIALAVRYSVGIELLDVIGYAFINLALLAFGVFFLTLGGHLSFKGET